MTTIQTTEGNAIPANSQNPSDQANSSPKNPGFVARLFSIRPDPSSPTKTTPPAKEIRNTLIMLVIFFAVIIYPLWNTWAFDMSAYFFAGHFYDIGQYDQVYAGPPQIIGPEIPPAWAAALQEFGYADKQTYPFIYFPWVAAAMAPISRVLDPIQVMNATAVVNCLALCASIVLAWRIVAPKNISLQLWTMISIALLATSGTSILALGLGQIQIVVYAFCLLAFERYRAGAFWWAGAALAIAACLKITPAALILIFLWDRNWRALGGFAAVCGALGAYSLLVIGWPMHAQFFGLLGALNEQIFVSRITFSIEALAYQIWDLVQGTAPIYEKHEYIYAKPAWMGILTKAVFASGIVAIWAVTRRLADNIRMPRQLLALSLLIPLTSPLGWVHYFLLATILLPSLFDFMGRKLAGSIVTLYLVFLNAHWIFAWVNVHTIVMPQVFFAVPFLIFVFLAILVSAKSAHNPDKLDTQNLVPA